MDVQVAGQARAERHERRASRIELSPKSDSLARVFTPVREAGAFKHKRPPSRQLVAGCLRPGVQSASKLFSVPYLPNFSRLFLKPGQS